MTGVFVILLLVSSYTASWLLADALHVNRVTIDFPSATPPTPPTPPSESTLRPVTPHGGTWRFARADLSHFPTAKTIFVYTLFDFPQNCRSFVQSDDQALFGVTVGPTTSDDFLALDPDHPVGPQNVSGRLDPSGWRAFFAPRMEVVVDGHPIQAIDSTEVTSPSSNMDRWRDSEDSRYLEWRRPAATSPFLKLEGRIVAVARNVTLGFKNAEIPFESLIPRRIVLASLGSLGDTKLWLPVSLSLLVESGALLFLCVAIRSKRAIKTCDSTIPDFTAVP